MVPPGQASALAVAPDAPQNLDAEESVLGAVLLSEHAIAAVVEVLNPTDFYRESHGKIYRAARSLYAEGKPVDAITVADELERRGELSTVGGAARVQELAALVPATSNVGHYAAIIREQAVLRGLLHASSTISQLARDRRGLSLDQILSQAEQTLYEISQSNAGGELSLLKDSLNETFERLSHLYENRLDVTGMSSGFRELDRITAGFQAGNLIILAARPSMGKSALGLAFASYAAVAKKKPCAFFALEMSRQEIVQRLMCTLGMVDSHKVRTGSLQTEDWSRLVKVCGELDPAPLYVDDTPAITLLELRSRLQTLKRKEPGLALVVVDYLQLMTAGGSVESRLQEVSTISRGLKSIARDLDVPVIALSQLSRAVEQRTDKRPVLSDLRESGGLEQDADLVMFLYRDDYYKSPEEMETSENSGIAELHVAKHRNGPTDTMKLAFVKKYAKFSSLPH